MMDSPKSTARLAGFIYLLVVITGLFHLMYVPSKLHDWNSPAATVNNIITHDTLFRLGIVVGIFGFISFLLLLIPLYKLLSPVNKTAGVLMVSLAAVSVPMSLVNILNKFAVLTLLSKANYLSGLTSEEIQTQVMMYLDFYRNGNQAAFIFWGLWLLPFGYLIYNSGFLPKILGLLLMLGCFGYVIDFIGGFLFPGYEDTQIGDYIRIPGSLGEIGICLWMLIMGVKESAKK